MIEHLNLQEELRGSQLHPTSLGSNVYRLEDRTPAHSFITILAALGDGRAYVAMTARDSFDEGMAGAILRHVEGAGDEATRIEVSRILPGFHHAPYGFDAVLLVSSRVHRLYRTQSYTLHARTLEAFPIFRCEFAGDETPEMINLIRHDSVSTIDWKRAAAPLTYLRFNNTGTGVRSTGKKLGLAKFSQLERIVRELTDEPENFVEVKNYRSETCRITVEGGGYRVNLPEPARQLTCAAPEVQAWMKRFLTHGLDAEL